MYTYEEMEEIKSSPPYQYAINSIDENNKNVGIYVKKQCQEFIDSIDSDKLINIMPNKCAFNNLSGFQWFFIANVLCLRRKSNDTRRYELSVMLIARKNGRRKPLERHY